MHFGKIFHAGFNIENPDVFRRNSQREQIEIKPENLREKPDKKYNGQKNSARPEDARQFSRSPNGRV